MQITVPSISLYEYLIILFYLFFIFIFYFIIYFNIIYIPLQPILNT